MKEMEGERDEKKKTLKLVGYTNFIRTNPRTDWFPVLGFHHVEFWCGDATNTSRRFSHALGLPIASKSDISTGNQVHASYLLASRQARLLFSAPYRPAGSSPGRPSLPSFDPDRCRVFAHTHGLAVRAIALLVEDAGAAFETSVAHGARPAFLPCHLGGGYVMAEVELYGDVVLRYVSVPGDQGFGFLPGFEDEVVEKGGGLWRIDHAVGCLTELGPAVEYLQEFTGFHEFQEFTSEDLEMKDTGVNGIVVANNTEEVLLLIAEPVMNMQDNGIKKNQNQVQTFLDYNIGTGVQHVALVSEDIVRTVREMRERSCTGGFEFLPVPPGKYYDKVRSWARDVLPEEQIRDYEELGVLVDRDAEGLLLQIFTKPIGDRPTFFIEIIQRIGCMEKDEEGREYQKGGCGGFGKGNVVELFRGLEEYQKSLVGKQ